MFFAKRNSLFIILDFNKPAELLEVINCLLTVLIYHSAAVKWKWLRMPSQFWSSFSHGVLPIIYSSFLIVSDTDSQLPFVKKRCDVSEGASAVRVQESQVLLSLFGFTMWLCSFTYVNADLWSPRARQELNGRITVKCAPTLAEKRNINIHKRRSFNLLDLMLRNS